MKKFVSLLLILMFSFGIVSTVKQEKAEAVSIVAGYTIVEIVGMLLAGATIVGSGAVIGDLALNPDDNHEFTDWLKNEYLEYMRKYQELPGQPPPDPKKLTEMESVALLSLLTKQGIEVGTDLYNMFYDFIHSDDKNVLPSDFNASAEFGFIMQDSGSVRTVILPTIDNTLFYEYTASGNKYLKANKTVKVWTSTNGGSWSNFGSYAHTALLVINQPVLSGNMPVFTDNTFQYLSPFSPIIGNPEPNEIPSVISKIGDYLLPDEFTPIFKNIDMSPLNGLVKSPQELIDIVNGVKEVPKYVLGKITNAFNEIFNNYIDNPNLVGASSPLSPTVDPATGLQVYGDPLPDEPEIESPEMPDSELSFWGKVLYWLKAIWQTLRDLPRNIVNKFSDLFDLVTIPLNALVGLIQNIWNWLQGVPQMIHDFFVPSLPAISETWQPVTDLFNQKIFPVIQPFQNIGFYEEELQDISADIKIGQYQGNHKIIDYSYLKSVRDPIKSVIRSFFWILIIFFNLDQVHRLIRNQSIVKTYIRKVDEPGGNK